MNQGINLDEPYESLIDVLDNGIYYLTDYGYVIIVIFMAMPVWFGRKLLINILAKRGESNSKIKQIKRTTFYFCFLISGVIFTPLWLDGFQEFGTVIGLITAAVAIALAQPLQSVTAGVFLIIKRPYVIGDRIEINGNCGEVSDITILYTTLLEVDTSRSSGQFTGRLLQIQNRHLFNSTIVNSSTMCGMTWEEISFTITYDSNWEEAKREFVNIVKSTVYQYNEEAEVAMRNKRDDFPIMATAPTVHISCSDYGIDLSARFLCPSINARNTKDKIWLRVLFLIESKAEIELAYPTKRIIQEKIAVEASTTNYLDRRIYVDEYSNAKKCIDFQEDFSPSKTRMCEESVKV